MVEVGSDGVMVLNDAFDAAPMADAMWDELARKHGALRDDRSTWKDARPSGFQKLSRSGVFEGIASPVVSSALDDLLGPGWHVAFGPPLVTFPTDAGWDVPRRSWHLDFGARDDRAAVRMFAYLNAVRPRGGGTLVVTGSHRVVANWMRANPAASGRSADVRTGLERDHPWFAELLSREDTPGRVARFMDAPTEIDGVGVRVVELTGEAGDVVLWHPWLLHVGAPNCLDVPRLMVTLTAFAAGTPS